MSKRRRVGQLSCEPSSLQSTNQTLPRLPIVLIPRLARLLAEDASDQTTDASLSQIICQTLAQISDPPRFYRLLACQLIGLADNGDATAEHLIHSVLLRLRMPVSLCLLANLALLRPSIDQLLARHLVQQQQQQLLSRHSCCAHAPAASTLSNELFARLLPRLADLSPLTSSVAHPLFEHYLRLQAPSSTSHVDGLLGETQPSGFTCNRAGLLSVSQPALPSRLHKRPRQQSDHRLASLLRRYAATADESFLESAKDASSAEKLHQRARVLQLLRHSIWALLNTSSLPCACVHDWLYRGFRFAVQVFDDLDWDTIFNWKIVALFPPLRLPSVFGHFFQVLKDKEHVDVTPSKLKWLICRSSWESARQSSAASSCVSGLPPKAWLLWEAVALVRKIVPSASYLDSNLSRHRPVDWQSAFLHLVHKGLLSAEQLRASLDILNRCCSFPQLPTILSLNRFFTVQVQKSMAVPFCPHRAGANPTASTSSAHAQTSLQSQFRDLPEIEVLLLSEAAKEQVVPTAPRLSVRTGSARLRSRCFLNEES